ncbi:MAG TPA: regulatory protein RecX, partial [Pseudonocardia sp.]|nr:regulatory protein RecX [Pseudonocardia sp.]
EDPAGRAAGGVPVAALDDVRGEDGRVATVAGFGDLDPRRPRAARTVRVDDLAGDPGRSRRGRGGAGAEPGRDESSEPSEGRRSERATGQRTRGSAREPGSGVTGAGSGDVVRSGGDRGAGGGAARRRTKQAAPAEPDREPDPPADPVVVAREICLRLLTDRARTRKELADALRRKGVPGEAAAEVLERFDEVGLIDDAAFADQWVRSRQRNRGLGRRAIAVELRRKGVADEVAKEALAGVDTESEARRARELVDRKLRSLPARTPEERARTGRRLLGMLARKGYGAGTAYQVVRAALAERGAEVDELGEADPLDD